MVTPLTYHGGKLQTLQYILPLIPAHDCYIEPFCGGATVFFAKRPAKVNILNDINELVVTFYKVLKNASLRRELIQKLDETPVSRELFNKAVDIFNSPAGHSDVDKAWSLFVACYQGRNGYIQKVAWRRCHCANGYSSWNSKRILLKLGELTYRLEEGTNREQRCLKLDKFR